MLSQRWAVKERDCYSVSAAKLLALTPVCCSSGITLTLGNQERDYILWSQCRRDSPGRVLPTCIPDPLAIESDKRPEEEFSRAFRASCCSPRTRNRCPCLLTEAEQACSLYGVRVGVCPGVGLEGWLRWFAHPFGGGVCRGQSWYPAFAPGSSKVVVWQWQRARGGGWSFVYYCP